MESNFGRIVFHHLESLEEGRVGRAACVNDEILNVFGGEVSRIHTHVLFVLSLMMKRFQGVALGKQQRERLREGASVVFLPLFNAPATPSGIGHYVLLWADVGASSFYLYDPMLAAARTRRSGRLEEWVEKPLKQFAIALEGAGVAGAASWALERVGHAGAKQVDSTSCGVHVMLAMLCIAQGLPVELWGKYMQPMQRVRKVLLTAFKARRIPTLEELGAC